MYRENFKISLREAIDKLFVSRQKYKDENDVVMQFLVNLLMTSLIGENIFRDNEETFSYKSEY